MQDKYAGDIGDFGKFVLLRQLCTVVAPQWILGVNWYYVRRRETRSTDGRHISYLQRTNRNFSVFHRCDPRLHMMLRNLVHTNRRSVRRLENIVHLPAPTLFFSERLTAEGRTGASRLADREQWFEQSLARLHTATAVFLDPDNGIQPPSITKADRSAVKYAFDDEIIRLFHRAALVVVYNHRDRTPSDVYKHKFIRLQRMCGPSALITVLRFKRVSVRDYLFLYRKEQKPVVNKLSGILTSVPFNFLFEELNVK